MIYLEIVKLALKGRSINATAKAWGVQQVTLNRYASGARLPNYATAKKMADEAGISYKEMLEALADAEDKNRSIINKIKKSFKNLVLKVGPQKHWKLTR